MVWLHSLKEGNVTTTLDFTSNAKGSLPGRDWYQVNELFVAPQGEGRLTGELCTFIRLQGCTVGCWWCDSGPLTAKGNSNGETSNTWGSGGSRMTVDAIMEKVVTQHVVITGGEPTLWNLDGLLDRLHPKHFVQLETSGQNALKGALIPDWITWSPKENLKYDADLDLKMRAAEVKWVVDDNLGLDVVMSTFRWYLSPVNQRYRLTLSPVRSRIPYFVFMPEGCPPTPEHVNEAINWLSLVPIEYQRYFSFGDRLQYRIGSR